MQKTISFQTLQRMPAYLNYLKGVDNEKTYISARVIAEALRLGEIQVRKDLSSVSSGGKPKIGYKVSDLINDIESFLGCKEEKNAVLIGAGKLGRALLSYKGFKNYGLNITAAFDINETDFPIYEDEKEIYPMEMLPKICKSMNIDIGIITVPDAQAQSVCDMLVENGIESIWNFAPVHLEAPKNVFIKNENMAISLAVLSRHLDEKNKL